MMLQNPRNILGLDDDGYIRFVSTVPVAADVDHRGWFYFDEGDPGVADKFYCIMKAADNSYSAVQIAIG